MAYATGSETATMDALSEILPPLILTNMQQIWFNSHEVEVSSILYISLVAIALDWKPKWGLKEEGGLSKVLRMG